MGKMKIPTHRRHVKGLGVVTVHGEDHYTGAWESPESEAEYRRIVAELLSTGRVQKRSQKAKGETVDGLAEKFAAEVRARYRKRGKETSYAHRAALLAAEVGAMHRGRSVADFGPNSLRALREGWVRTPEGGEARMSRSTANESVAVIVRMFRWGVARELVPAATWQALASVEPLTRRDGGREPEVVGSVDPALVEQTLGWLGEVPSAIVRLIWASGMRPSEACSIRPCDLEYPGDAWIYRVHADWNKTDWTGRRRTVYLGPKAQEALCGPGARWTGREDHIFRPDRHSSRRGNQPYLANTLEKLIHRGCVRHGIPEWNPYQLRHLALTRIHGAMGLDAARVTGGHSSIKTTLGYIDEDVATAEDRAKAREVALALG